MKKTYIKYMMMLALVAGICACGEKGPDTPELPQEEQEERIAVGTFAANVMNIYYLWKDEIADSLSKWKLNEDHIEKVKRIRYKDASGKDIDKWTVLTDDIEAMKQSTAGVNTTYGFDFKLYFTDSSRKYICMVVTLVYPDSPAAKAGIKRGDVFLKISGVQMSTDNYGSLVYDSFLYAPACSLTDIDDKVYNLTAVEMYENPVLVTKVFEVNGKKVGYLLFNRFTLAACKDLVEAGKYFTGVGIDDLILDMRYNSGGYVFTENVLASMLAPWAEVEAGSVFETAVYNDILAEAWGDEKSRFSKQHTYTDEKGNIIYDVSVVGANPGIKHLYAILTNDSASASESVLVGLMPYLDVKIFGQQSYGKYCTGIMYSAKDWYKDYEDALKDSQKNLGKKYAGKWGIYVMIGRYADKNGNTPCMPDGFIPDYPVEDDPTEGYQLGDERETMLAAVLARLSGETGARAAASRTAARTLGAELPLEHRDPAWGAHILLH
jgi:C-terminal processing protease CtpA/Prc